MSVIDDKEAKGLGINEAVTYENGIPKDGGLMDLRMGTTDKAFKCKTCSGDRTECPGHFGHIELAKPMLHVGFIPFVLKLLRCVCFHCSAILAPSVRFALYCILCWFESG